MTIHFIGLGGIGMSALARICHQRGMQVTGSDRNKSQLIETLIQEGIAYQTPTFTQGSIVVVSTAIAENHPELMAARAVGAQVCHRSDLLAQFTREATTFAVAGTHGKTTVSSLLTHLLDTAGISPSYCVGGIIGSLGSNGGWTEGAPFVIEADESDGTFQKYDAQIAIVTNIDDDHMDHYGSSEALDNAFSCFMANCEKLVVCAEDLRLMELAPEHALSYGFCETADYQIKEGQQGEYVLVEKKRKEGEKKGRKEEKKEEKMMLPVPLPGRHQILNAAAVAAVGCEMGLPIEVIQRGLATFQGVQRRSQRLSEGEVVIIDDYAHHPTEIAVTLEGVAKEMRQKEVRQRDGERRMPLVAIFQPHRYSRTGGCMERLRESFAAADEVVVTEIYGAGEEPVAGIDHFAVVKAIGKKAYFIPREQVVQKLCEKVSAERGKRTSGEVFLFLGAGDITQAAHEMAERVTSRCCP